MDLNESFLLDSKRLPFVPSLRPTDFTHIPSITSRFFASSLSFFTLANSAKSNSVSSSLKIIQTGYYHDSDSSEEESLLSLSSESSKSPKSSFNLGSGTWRARGSSSFFSSFFSSSFSLILTSPGALISGITSLRIQFESLSTYRSFSCVWDGRSFADKC